MPLTFESKYLLMVARLDFKSKDFLTVIEAYDLLPDPIKNEYKLVFLGDGDARFELEAIIKEKKLTKKIILQGYDPNPYKWYRNAVCNILSSKTEGFSVSVIEAMVVGCPEILTNYKTSATEVSSNGRNTLLVEIGDIHAMKDAILLLIENEIKRESLKSNARMFVNNFSKENFEISIMQLFEQFCS
ncbi:MAG: glycosyltransferase [Clostridia bacterium]|nr:glycosyltransferase [Clostridia bacterium]